MAAPLRFSRSKIDIWNEAGVWWIYITLIVSFCGMLALALFRESRVWCDSVQNYSGAFSKSSWLGRKRCDLLLTCESICAGLQNLHSFRTASGSLYPLEQLKVQLFLPKSETSRIDAIPTDNPNINQRGPCEVDFEKLFTNVSFSWTWGQHVLNKFKITSQSGFHLISNQSTFSIYHQSLKTAWEQLTFGSGTVDTILYTYLLCPKAVVTLYIPMSACKHWKTPSGLQPTGARARSKRKGASSLTIKWADECSFNSVIPAFTEWVLLCHLVVLLQWRVNEALSFQMAFSTYRQSFDHYGNISSTQC